MSIRLRAFCPVAQLLTRLVYKVLAKDKAKIPGGSKP